MLREFFRIRSRAYYIISCSVMVVLVVLTIITFALGLGLYWIMILVVLAIVWRMVRDMLWHWRACG